jgi:hypothetical protein
MADRRHVVLYCFCGDAEQMHVAGGPCGCGCPRFMLDTVDPRHDKPAGTSPPGVTA